MAIAAHAASRMVKRASFGAESEEHQRASSTDSYPGGPATVPSQRARTATRAFAGKVEQANSFETKEEGSGKRPISWNRSTSLKRNLMQIIDDQAKSESAEPSSKRFLSCGCISAVCCTRLIHPEGKLKRYWDIISCVAVVYIAIMLPLELSFFWDELESDFRIGGHAGGVDFTIVLTIFSWIVTIVFLADIVVKMRTAKFDKISGELIVSNRVIIRRYLTKPIGFWFDLITSFPFSEIVAGIVNLQVGTDSASQANLQAVTSYLSYINAFKLLRLARITKIFKYLDVHLNVNKSSLTIIKLICTLLLLLHWFACLWFRISIHHLETIPDATGTLKHAVLNFKHDGWIIAGDWQGLNDAEFYVLCMYWSVTTLTSVGYGDITPTDNAEIVLTICVQLLGSLFTSYVFGAFSVALASFNREDDAFQGKLQRVKQLCLNNHVPPDIVHKVFDFYRYAFLRRRDFARQSNIIEDLPDALHEEVIGCIEEGMLRKTVLFEHCGSEHEMLYKIALLLETSFNVPQDIIFVAGDESSDLYFIKSGVVDMQDQSSTELLCDHTEGDFFGDNYFLPPDKDPALRYSTAVTMSYCIFSMVTETDLDQMEVILQEVPKVLQAVRQIAKARHTITEKAAGKLMGNASSSAAADDDGLGDPDDDGGVEYDDHAVCVKITERLDLDEGFQKLQRDRARKDKQTRLSPSRSVGDVMDLSASSVVEVEESDAAAADDGVDNPDSESQGRTTPKGFFVPTKSKATKPRLSHEQLVADFDIDELARDDSFRTATATTNPARSAGGSISEYFSGGTSDVAGSSGKNPLFSPTPRSVFAIMHRTAAGLPASCRVVGLSLLWLLRCYLCCVGCLARERWGCPLLQLTGHQPPPCYSLSPPLPPPGLLPHHTHTKKSKSESAEPPCCFRGPKFP